MLANRGFLFVLIALMVVQLGIADEPADDDGCVSLFDGKSLEGWKVTDFAGHAEPRVEDGKIILPFGSDMTGITYTGKHLIKTNYEIELDAMRVDGNDFFCGLTFPVGDSSCSLICGGWGGGLVGLSSINGMDASENATSSYREFKKGEWYHIHVRVTNERIQAWIDKDEVVNFEIVKNRLSIRLEVELSKPLGIATWCTTGAAKNICLRAIEAED